MGMVYEALDQRVNCIVALKETLAINEDESRRAFEREASLLANLRHPALPKVMDYFTEDESDYLVMEFIPGYDLAELLELRGSPFPQTQVLRWAIDLLKVLEYLHGQKPPILHRDIKPSNLKLTKQGEVFLLDFGLAKGAIGQMQTMVTSRSVRGYTPVYAPLEQIHGQGTDPRSDLYSLGATLYHLLTGVPPVNAPTRFHAVEEEQPDPLKPIEQLNPQVSSNVAAVIHQALAISRKQRPASAAEMRKALRNASEEDERHAAEEEYALAEARRRQVEEERRRAEEEAARIAEEERRRQEAETRRFEEERRRLEEEAAARRAEEERQKEIERQKREAEEEEARRAEALRRQEEAERQRRESADKSYIKTIKVTPFKIFVPHDHVDPSDGTHTENKSPSVRPILSKVIIAGAALALVITIALIVILTQNSRNDKQIQLSSQAPLSSPVKPQDEANRNKPMPPEGMISVSGGTFMMGRNGGDVSERPAHQVSVKPFFIDAYEVTNENYAKFIQAAGHNIPATWTTGSYPDGAARRPVTGVAWDDAVAYCKWAGKRLPTEEEWEFAARGTDGRIYPWGNDWQQDAANANGARTDLVDVGSYKGQSPFGAFDMVGNAWEWTASDFRAYPGGSLPTNLPSGDLKVIRGGSYESLKDVATVTYRTGWPARGAKTYSETGFRCVQDIAP